MVHTDFALRRPVTTLMAFAAVAVIGLVSSRLLPLEQYPDVSFPFMGAGVPYPGFHARGNRRADHAPHRGCAGDAARHRGDPFDLQRPGRALRNPLRLGHGHQHRRLRGAHQARLGARATAEDRGPHVDVDGLDRRRAHAHGALLGRPGSVLAIRPAGPLLQETHRAHRRRGPRRARGRRGARGAHPGRPGPARRARRRRAAAGAAAREEQFLGGRRPDHRQRRALLGAPARRIPLARRNPQSRHQGQRAHRRRRHRGARQPGDHSATPSRRPARPWVSTYSSPRRPTSSKWSTTCSPSSRRTRRCRRCRASACSSSTTRPKRSARRCPT